MTDLLVPSAPSGSRAGAASGGGTGLLPGRPLALTAAAAGVAAPAVALLLLWAVGLVGWFAADGGSHGTTRSALRVAADGWLLGHGAHLAVAGETVVTASPLGLTLACLALAYRFGRWSGATSAVEDLRAAGLGTVVLAGAYGLSAFLVAVLASAPAAEPGFASAFLGGTAVGAVGGGIGLLRGAGLLSSLRARLPDAVLAAATTAAVLVAAMVVSGSVLVAVAVGLRGAAGANVVEQLDLDPAGAALSLLLLAAITPNAALLAGGYLLGPGFAVGAATVVAPGEVVLGPVPAVPVLGALPPDGWAPAGMVAVLAVPVLCGVVASVAGGLVHPASAYLRGAARSLAGGAAGCALLTLLMTQAGGAIGPGRMSVTGVDGTDTAVAAAMLVLPATLVGGLLATWWARRRERRSGL